MFPSRCGPELFRACFRARARHHRMLPARHEAFLAAFSAAAGGEGVDKLDISKKLPFTDAILEPLLVEL